MLRFIARKKVNKHRFDFVIITDITRQFTTTLTTVII